MNYRCSTFNPKDLEQGEVYEGATGDRRCLFSIETILEEDPKGKPVEKTITGWLPVIDGEHPDTSAPVTYCTAYMFALFARKRVS